MPIPEPTIEQPLSPPSPTLTSPLTAAEISGLRELIKRTRPSTPSALQDIIVRWLTTRMVERACNSLLIEVQNLQPSSAGSVKLAITNSFSGGSLTPSPDTMNSALRLLPPANSEMVLPVGHPLSRTLG